jgi:uncharacterized repeat protein (TIGR03803 family)
MKALSLAIVCLAAVALLPQPSAAQTGYTILHRFTTAEGSEPVGGLIMEGSHLYGMTETGGSAGFGTAFNIASDGTGFSLLHSFAGAPSDGKEPPGGFVSDGNRLYGVTKEGGPGDFGLLFRMNTNGTDITSLWNFGGPLQGEYPSGKPLLCNGRLYGVTYEGGASDQGVLFSTALDGADKTILHNFGSGSDGKSPGWGLLEQGGKLYGTTVGGGTSNIGTVYSIGTDGAGYSVLHDFSGSAAIGPTGILVSDGSQLYGAAMYGGAAHVGTVFSLAVGGGEFTILHEFAGPPNDGAGPFGGLALDGDTLYGTTMLGGQHSPIGGGTLFSLKTDGTGYTILHHFAGDDVSPADGCQPQGDLLISSGTLYGTTTAPGDGTIYSLPLGSLRLTLNKTTLVAGDRLTMDVLVQPIAQAFDAWAVILGTSASYSMTFGSPGSVRSGAHPFVTGIGGLATAYSGRLLDLAIPAGAAGTYQLIVGLVPAGTSPTGVGSCIAGYVDQRTVTVQ